MDKVNNYKLIREYYRNHFDTCEDDMNKGKSYQDSLIHPYELVITFHELSSQLMKFSKIIKKFSDQIKNECNEKDKPSSIQPL